MNLYLNFWVYFRIYDWQMNNNLYFILIIVYLCFLFDLKCYTKIIVHLKLMLKNYNTAKLNLFYRPKLNC